MTGRGAFAGVKANGFKILNQPIGGCVTVLAIGRICLDARNAQQLEEMLGCLVDVSVNVSQNGVERSCGHGISRQIYEANLLTIDWILAPIVKQKHRVFRISLWRCLRSYLRKMYISEEKRWLNLAY